LAFVVLVKTTGMTKILSKKELYSMNTIAVKVENQTRKYAPTIGNAMIEKSIRRTSYLKICWMCGTAFESHKVNTIACSPRCSQNIWYARSIGLNPPANVPELTKPKNVKEIKERMGYL
jgi:hypothetical protein